MRYITYAPGCGRSTLKQWESLHSRCVGDGELIASKSRFVQKAGPELQPDGCLLGLIRRFFHYEVAILASDSTGLRWGDRERSV
jgi:hypothetical protein